MAETKLKDWLLNCIYYKTKSLRVLHMLNMFGIENPFYQDEI